MRILIAFGISTLFLGFLVPPLGFAGGDEEKAAAALKKLGARLIRDDKQPHGPIIAVIVNNPKEEFWGHLPALKDLEALLLFSAILDGKELLPLKDAKNLRLVVLGFTVLTSEKGFEHLKELNQVRHVGIDAYTTIAKVREPAREIRAVLPKAVIIPSTEGYKFLEKRLGKKIGIEK